MKDYSDIPQEWIREYTNQFLKIAVDMPQGLFKDAILRRVECCQDLVKAYQERNIPMEKR
jgi:hypothetical protein